MLPAPRKRVHERRTQVAPKLLDAHGLEPNTLGSREQLALPPKIVARNVVQIHQVHEPVRIPRRKQEPLLTRIRAKHVLTVVHLVVRLDAFDRDEPRDRVERVHAVGAGPLALERPLVNQVRPVELHVWVVNFRRRHLWSRCALGQQREHGVNARSVPFSTRRACKQRHVLLDVPLNHLVPLPVIHLNSIGFQALRSCHLGHARLERVAALGYNLLIDNFCHFHRGAQNLVGPLGIRRRVLGNSDWITRARVILALECTPDQTCHRLSALSS